MVRTQDFHAWDAGFNSRGSHCDYGPMVKTTDCGSVDEGSIPSSHLSTGSIMDRIFDYESKDTGSNPVWCIYYKFKEVKVCLK